MIFRRAVRWIEREREREREGGRETQSAENEARKCGARARARARGERGEVGKDYGASTAMTERAVIAVPI